MSRHHVQLHVTAPEGALETTTASSMQTESCTCVHVFIGHTSVITQLSQSLPPSCKAGTTRPAGADDAALRTQNLFLASASPLSALRYTFNTVHISVTPKVPTWFCAICHDHPTSLQYIFSCPSLRGHMLYPFCKLVVTPVPYLSCCKVKQHTAGILADGCPLLQNSIFSFVSRITTDVHIAPSALDTNVHTSPPTLPAVGGIFVRTLFDDRITTRSIHMHCHLLT